jgi:elongation factor Ts
VSLENRQKNSLNNQLKDNQNMANLELIKQLRADTGAGIADVKEALEISKDDMVAAKAYLQKKGIAKAEKRLDREANQGVIASYIHNTNKIAVLVEVNCETDFVAKNEDFIRFGKDVAMQIAAMSPEYISESEIPESLKEEFAKEVGNNPKFTGKPSEILQNIIDSKVKTYASETTLLGQAFFNDTNTTIGEMLKILSAKVGEAIKIKKFVRMEVGGSMNVKS